MKGDSGTGPHRQGQVRTQNENSSGTREAGTNGQRIEIVWTGSAGDEAAKGPAEERSDNAEHNLESQMSSADAAECVTPKLHGRKIMDFMRIYGSDKGMIGIKNLKGKNINDLDVKHRGNVVKIVKKIMMRACQDFVPSAVKSLVCAFF